MNEKNEVEILLRHAKGALLKTDKWLTTPKSECRIRRHDVRHGVKKVLKQIKEWETCEKKSDVVELSAVDRITTDDGILSIKI